jgi:AraC-type DNA-binding domain-containing proteins
MHPCPGRARESTLGDVSPGRFGKAPATTGATLMRDPHSKEEVRIWRPPVLPGVELLRATYVTQTFARHTHEGFAVGVIEAGALGFFYRGANVVAARGAVNLANPDEAHTGHAATPEGWSYRMFYLEADLLREAARQVAGKPVGMPFFQAGVLEDDSLAGAIRALHVSMEDGALSTLEKESRHLLMLTALIRRHADAPPALHRAGRERGAVDRTRRHIEEHHAEDLSIETLAALAGFSPYHFIRVFAAETGLPPHAYLNQARVRRARDLLAGGWSIAAAAAETGFSDQSHLTRHFKRIHGMTPGQFLHASNFVQDARLR